MNPLVSVIVVTYNSANFVLETLESIADQTYKNIELIISDDCSSDNTLKLCQNWIDSHYDRFINTKILSVQKNGGIPANCNRGITASQGEWIKLIAGDDILLPNCINENVVYINLNTSALAIQSFSDIYKKDFTGFATETAPSSSTFSFFNLESGQEQHKFLLYNKNVIYAPSMFLNKNFIMTLGGFDEEYHLFEDLPMWLKITASNTKIYLLKKSTVGYRLHDSITAANNNNRIYNENFMKEIIKLKKNYILPKIPWYHLAFFQARLWENLQFQLFIKVFKNRRTRLTDIISYLFAITNFEIIKNKFSNGKN